MGYSSTTVNSPFTATADVTVGNTASELTAIPSGVGTLTFPANWFAVGRTLRVWGEGIYSTPLVSGSATIRVKLGTTTLASMTTTSLVGSITNQPFTFDVRLTCRAVGASGSFVMAGSLSYATGTGVRAIDSLNNGGAAVTVNTTQALALDVTVQWSAADPARTLTTKVATVEFIGVN